MPSEQPQPKSPVWLVRDAEGLDIYEYSFLMTVASRGICHVTVDRNCRDMRMSRSKYFMVLKRLRERGLIEVTEKFVPATGKSMPTEIQIVASALESRTVHSMDSEQVHDVDSVHSMDRDSPRGNTQKKNVEVEQEQKKKAVRRVDSPRKSAKTVSKAKRLSRDSDASELKPKKAVRKSKPISASQPQGSKSLWKKPVSDKKTQERIKVYLNNCALGASRDDIARLFFGQEGIDVDAALRDLVKSGQVKTKKTHSGTRYYLVRRG